MLMTAVARRLDRLQTALTPPVSPRTNPVLRSLATDRTTALRWAGLYPDPWQARLLTAPSVRTLLLCSRQSGKSSVAAGLAVNELLLAAPALVLLLSPTQRQSVELFRKAITFLDALGRPVPVLRETTTELELVNGSRLVALPENEQGVRCFSGVRLLVVDEAARVGDPLYRAIRPMLAVSGGRLIALSTPFGQRGFFYEAWERGGPSWRRVRVPAEQCPRISPAFLAEERQALGEAWFSQEYTPLEFRAAEGAVFDPAAVDAAFVRDVHPPLLGSAL